MTKFVDSKNYNFLNNKINTYITNDHKNIIFYGPKESKLYNNAIKYIEKLSKSSLSYDKKLIVTYNNDEYIYRISDAHIEINFEFLGCIAKNLWASIYYHIEQIALSRSIIIVCKNFCSVNNELIDNFYTYVSANNKNISYLFLVHNISCLPKELLDICSIIPIKRIALSKIESAKINNSQPDKLFNLIKTYDSFNVKYTREVLYNILIYQNDVYTILYELLKKIEQEIKPSEQKMFKLLNEINNIIKLFNNNYRSIYHLENMVLSIITILYN